MIEYRDIHEKSSWGPGPWADEPDKKQWKDAVTGLPCLAVRGPMGAWCGYVGVAPRHPLHHIDYSTPATLPRDLIRALLTARGVADLYADDIEAGAARPESLLDIHGGITFSDGCAEVTEEDWRQFRQAALSRGEEARKFPMGDAARLLSERSAEIESFEKWRDWMAAAAVCHVPEPGEPENVWWFGFDCAHLHDLVPRMVETRRTLYAVGHKELAEQVIDRQEIYRTLAYVEEQCALLAAQLAAVSAWTQAGRDREEGADVRDNSGSGRGDSAPQSHR